MRLGWISPAFPLCAILLTVAQGGAQTTNASYTISGWRLECGTQNNALNCQVLDQVSARNNGAVIAAVTVTRDEVAKDATIVVQAPLGIVALDEPVRIVSNGLTQTIPFVVCNANGCFARAPLMDSLLAAMRAGKTPFSVAYRVIDSSGKRDGVTVTLAMDGFSAAYAKLSEK